ncbi:MAG: hypothetical protein IH597_02010 [Bacteroidales bacterium]|nr:hypothetical protein [Bacteroidales bacterium]
MKKHLIISLLAAIVAALLFTAACRHEPIEGPPVNPPDDCDTTNITFAGTIMPLLDQYCISCHVGATPEAGLDFTDFSAIAFVAQNGALLGSIRHEEGFTNMPAVGDKLSDCDIRKFEIWVRDTTFTEPPVGIPCDPDTVYFQNTILPLLQSSCALSGCHDVATAQNGVILNNYENIMETGDVRPGRPGSSDLYEAITESDPRDRMPPPPMSPLNVAQREAIFNWIMQGALNNYCDDIDCDTLNVTFSGTVWPVIQNRCFGCHNGASASGGIRLENHANLVTVANSGQLMGAIRHDQGFSPMPQNGQKLSDCNITQIQLWINDGTPAN